MALRQINMRLPAEDVELFELAAFLEGESIAEYLRPLLEARLQELRGDQALETMARLRAERAAEREGTLSSLDRRRRSGNE